MKIKKNLKNNIFAAFTAFASLSMLFTGCEFLQGTLSSVQKEKLILETGSPSYDYKVWYYNGYSGEDMSLISDSSSNNYANQSLCINFGQKVCLNSVTPSGKMVISYTDSQGDAASKTISSLNGKFSKDYKSYYLDMSPVTKLLAGSTNSATVDIKMSGFICAEGNQSGRPVSAFEFSGLSIRPLYNNLTYDFSTVGFNSQAKFKIPLRANISIKDGSYDFTVEDSSSNEYTFTVSSDKNEIFLTPKFSTKPADGTNLTLTLNNILADGCGDSYSKSFDITFRKNLIVIDGLEDSNWTSSYSVFAEDESGDTAAEGWRNLSN